jgi:hypothetical protein
MKRRAFLQVLGGVGLGARSAAEQALASVSGVTRFPGFGAPMKGDSYGDPPSGGMRDDDGLDHYQKSLVACSKYIKTIGMPDFYDRHLRDKARAVYRMDEDIAAKRSWSWSVKMQEQRQRNYKRLVNDMHLMSENTVARSLLKKLTGWTWPWY